MRLDSYIVLDPVTPEIVIRLVEAMAPREPSQVTSTPLAAILVSTAAFRVMMQRSVKLDSVNIGGSIRTEGVGTADTEYNASVYITVYSVYQ